MPKTMTVFSQIRYEIVRKKFSSSYGTGIAMGDARSVQRRIDQVFNFTTTADKDLSDNDTRVWLDPGKVMRTLLRVTVRSGSSVKNVQDMIS